MAESNCQAQIALEPPQLPSAVLVIVPRIVEFLTHALSRAHSRRWNEGDSARTPWEAVFFSLPRFILPGVSYAVIR